MQPLIKNASRRMTGGIVVSRNTFFGIIRAELN